MAKRGMTARVRQAIDTMKAEYDGTSAYTWKEWTAAADKAGISFDTFAKYNKFEEIEHKKEWTIEQLVNLLNEVSGEDLYGSSFNFITENGKAYEVSYTYKWIGEK